MEYKVIYPTDEQEKKIQRAALIAAYEELKGVAEIEDPRQILKLIVNAHNAAKEQIRSHKDDILSSMDLAEGDIFMVSADADHIVATAYCSEASEYDPESIHPHSKIGNDFLTFAKAFVAISKYHDARIAVDEIFEPECFNVDATSEALGL